MVRHTQTIRFLCYVKLPLPVSRFSLFETFFGPSCFFKSFVLYQGKFLSAESLRTSKCPSKNNETGRLPPRWHRPFFK